MTLCNNLANFQLVKTMCSNCLYIKKELRVQLDINNKHRTQVLVGNQVYKTFSLLVLELTLAAR